ncbi:hypothetical protein DPEC_G00110950 [Dallia pectoralis]|uniref:Uncharacterized protein n=1 Tax=Dallia pectoralis TaxID=75939 RepID=A0ACC2GT65_DALPE|nr:hypothetical protein DPEC_G00110950 [Dallia pectoralis]
MAERGCRAPGELSRANCSWSSRSQRYHHSPPRVPGGRGGQRESEQGETITSPSVFIEDTGGRAGWLGDVPRPDLPGDLLGLGGQCCPGSSLQARPRAIAPTNHPVFQSNTGTSRGATEPAELLIRRMRAPTGPTADGGDPVNGRTQAASTLWRKEVVRGELWGNWAMRWKAARVDRSAACRS